MPKVLLIDTQAHILEVLRRKFESEGFDVFSLNTCEAHQEQVLSFKPDLIVLGKAPGEGKHLNVLTQELRLSTGSPDVPIILITTGFEEEHVADVPHLKMPFRPSQLMAMAREAVAV